MANIEQTFNQALGEVLREISRGEFDVAVEQRGVLDQKAKQPDILINDGKRQPFIIEVSYGRADANADAKARIGKSLPDGKEILSTIAVCVDAKFRERDLPKSIDALRSGAEIEYALHQKVNKTLRRFPETGFLRGTAHDLAALFPTATMPQETVDDIADKVTAKVNLAATYLSNKVSIEIQKEITGLMFQNDPLKGLQTASVLLLNALIVQHHIRINQRVAGVPSVTADLDNPNTLEQIKVWREILKYNWNTIFEPAIDSLEKANNFNPAGATRALAILKDAAHLVISNESTRLVHIGAEIFPKLSDDRKKAAAFYTEPATAEFLAQLTIRPEQLAVAEWLSPDLFKNFHLADMACGTGTLLRAGYQRVVALHNIARLKADQNTDYETDISKLHKGAMEHGIIGTDVSGIATHLSVSSLAVLGGVDAYGDTNIGWVGVGKPDKTGALEYFEAMQLESMFATEPAKSKSAHGRVSGATRNAKQSAVAISNEACQWILMNPPYSRTRGGQSAFDIAGLSDDERKACQTRWGNLIKGEPANKKAGMAASFLALSKHKLKPGGTLGFVLPLTAASAESWQAIRQEIETKFKDIVAIALSKGYDAGALSADTGMNEMMLVATRREPDEVQKRPVPAPIRCVTLTTPIQRISEAREIARAVQDALNADPAPNRPILLGDEQCGTVTQFEATGEGKPWSHLGATNAELAFFAEGIASGKFVANDGDIANFPLSMSTIGDEFNVGPTHHLIGHFKDSKEKIGAFEIHKLGKKDATVRDLALWSAESEEQTQLLVVPTHKGIKTGDAKLVAKMQAATSTLFYARNLRWTSQKLLSATTAKSVLGGSAWVGLQHSDSRALKLAALWFNSTFGLMVHWTQGQRTHRGRARTQIKAVHNMPTPAFSAL